MKIIYLLVISSTLNLALAQNSSNIKSDEDPSLAWDLIEFWLYLPDYNLTMISESHMESDPALSAVVHYLQSDSFKSLSDEIISKTGAKSFLEYLNSVGFPTKNLLDSIRGLLESIEPGVAPDNTASLRPFLDDIESVLPIDRLVKVWNDKLENSKNFQEFFKKISDEERHQLVDEVLQMHEVVKLQRQLRIMGVRVDESWKKIYAYFGWGSPPASSN